MRNILIYKMALGCVMSLTCTAMTAQTAFVSSNEAYHLNDTEKRLQNYEELKSLGYTEKEIYEDLGNAHFLSRNYESALYWYDKLTNISEDGTLEPSYQKRYDHALSKLGKTATDQKEQDENWTELVKADYHMTDASSKKMARRTSFRDNFKPLHFNTETRTASLGNVMPYRANSDNFLKDDEYKYESPVVVTPDGNTAYFSKVVMEKPTTGIFSKKEKQHRIYRADKVNGEWKSIKELPLCPKGYSAMHPAISEDGSRLFFASNMPGSFGKYDIYVANIKKGGMVGIAKNLGQKVNTEKNDMFPKVVEGNTLVFSSEGHKGYGGMDIYMVQVEKKKVGLAMNLGSPINSPSDDFSIELTNDQGMGYVMSNRGNGEKTAHKVAFSYIGKKDFNHTKDYQLMEALNTESQLQYSSSVFEDEK